MYLALNYGKIKDRFPKYKIHVYIHDCKNVTFKFLVVGLIGKTSPMTAHTILSNYYYNYFIV